MAETKGYENSLVGLAENYGLYFEDDDTSFGAEDWYYICDPDTYELLLVKASAKGIYLNDKGNWRGRKCYEFLEGRKAPCKDCPLGKFRHDNMYVRIHSNPYLGREYFVEGMNIDWQGKKAAFQTAINISDPEFKNKVMDEYITARNTLTTVLSRLLTEKHITENFAKVCKDIGTFFGADRAIITEYISGKLNAEWSRLDGPFTQVCTELSEAGLAELTRATSGLKYIWVPDVANADKLNSDLKQYWTAHGIRSILLIPMQFKGGFIGTVSLHNISAHFSAIETLNLVGLAVAKCIHSYVMESKAEQQLYTDPLTGSLNLSGLKRRAYELFREYPDNKYYFCVFDIRCFGGLNRRYSFELGDRILVKVAENLRKYMDSDEVFCRISADQFCFMSKYPGEEKVRKRFEKFIESMQCFEELKAANYRLEIQAGVFIPDERTVNVALAIDRANLARRSLKDNIGSGVAFFSSELMENSRRETELLQDFRPALAAGELSVFYQPQCRYTSQKIVGAEALVRWKSPKHGNVSPADFIPLLERHGLIYELDKFVWEEVCRAQQKWLKMGAKCPISVNVSRYDMLRNDICEYLCGLLDKYSVPKELLPLEITETAYIKNSEELINAVDRLKDAGFMVEMDDFGSGYSSLNALKDVSVDLLKLDMKFLDMEGRTGRGGSILNCIVRMTRWLNLAVLAEGVETKEQAEYLKNIGCDLMQGYYFAKPMPESDFEVMLLADCSAEDNPTGEESEDSTLLTAEKLVESVVENPLLFNRMGAAAIVEFSENNLEALMINDSFLEMLDMTRQEYTPYMKNMVWGTSGDQVKDAFIKAARYVTSCDCQLRRKDGTLRSVRVYCRRLMCDGGKRILLLTIDDVSDIVVDNVK